MATQDEISLQNWRNALDALATAQSYTMPDGRSLTRTDVSKIMEVITWLEQRIAAAKEPADGTGFISTSIW